MTAALILLAAPFAFCLLWALGANDVANALGTSVGSGALTVRQGIIIAAIFEFAGSTLMGGHVATTLKSKLADRQLFASDKQFCVGMIASLISSFIWLVIGTWFGLPLSSTHTILGSVLGFAILAVGPHAIYWDQLGLIALSWVVSPLLGALISNIVYRVVDWLIIADRNTALEKARKYVPVFFGMSLSTNVVFVITSGPEALRVSLDVGVLVVVFVVVWVVGFVVAKALVTLSITRPSVWMLPEYRYFVDEHERAHVQLEIRQPNQLQQQQQQQQQQQKQTGTTEQANQSNTNTSTSTNDDIEVITIMQGQVDITLAEQHFVPLLVLSASTVAFAHGGNDVANGIGPFYTVLNFVQEGTIGEESSVPVYVTMVGGLAIVLGLSMWGYRVMATIGRKITKLSYAKAYCAEFGASISIMVATRLGMPISTTSVIVGAVMGVGLAHHGSVNLAMFVRIFAAWMLTLPVAGLMAMAIFAALSPAFGV